MSLRANMAAAARTVLLLLTDAVHQALLPVYYLFTEACWEMECSHRGAQNATQTRTGTIFSLEKDQQLRPNV